MSPVKPLVFIVSLVCLSTAFADIALTGATVHTLTQAQPLENARILIKDGKVSNVGGVDLNIPDGFEIIDVSGKVITPGLIESYSQLGLHEIDLEVSTNDSMVVDYPQGPSFDIAYAINSASTLLPVNVVEGVTRAIVAPRAANDPFAGWASAISLGNAGLATDVLTHPRIALFASFTLETTAFVGSSRGAVIQRVRQALSDAKSYSGSRYAAGRYAYEHADMAALRGFVKSNAALVIEAHRAKDIAEALAIGRDYQRQVAILGGTEAWQLAVELAEAKVPVIIDVFANLPVSFSKLGARLDNAALLHAAGVQVALTAEETQNARQLRQLAGNAVAHGLPWAAGLASITKTPADIWRLDDVGSIADGQRADLVVWNGDPLELSVWAERVMIDGRWISMDSRQTRLYERYQQRTNDKRPHSYR